ncbi:MAG: hypothetical protein HYR84_05445 [Planctomycetes bacterium]|nr:hypothetical protein [Planctomycetota bacterium]
MARVQWPLRYDRPVIEVVLTLALGAKKVSRVLLADTGAGNAQAPFELLLDENDCLLCGGRPMRNVPTTGAYAGSFPLYVLPVEIPLLNFADIIPALGVPTPPAAFDGIACFRFLNRFSYGNFGDSGRFGLEI